MANASSDARVPLAAIDMGSNSFRLEIAEASGHDYRRVAYHKQSVRLGAGLDAHRNLSDSAAERGLQCLRAFASELKGFAPAHVRAVATQTLREAANRNAFLLRAQDALGFAVEIISGREEARLIYAGVARMQPSERSRLVIDIGGRSTELIIGAGLTPTVAESFPVGCVSATLRHFPDGHLTAAGFAAAQVAAGAEFEEAAETFHRSRWQEVLGSSGTASAVSQALAASKVTDGTITPEGVRWLMDRCIEAGHIDRLRLPGMKPDRAPVIAGGLAILQALCAQFDITEIRAARGALRQGVIFDMAERLQPDAREPTDTRRQTVAELQRRFGADPGRAALVRGAALALHEQIAPQAAAEQQQELGWACDLHELGLVVSHHDYHRHGSYLVANADAAGFSQSLQRRVADIVLGQRGGLRKVEDAMARAGYAQQAMALRLALLELHDRSARSGGALVAKQRGSQVTITVSRDWAERHPRTLFLLREEVQVWSRSDVLTLVLRER